MCELLGKDDEDKQETELLPPIPSFPLQTVTLDEFPDIYSNIKLGAEELTFWGLEEHQWSKYT